jgi:glutamyl-tRNA synthetase
MVKLFDIADVNKSASAFNGEKLAWLNQQHIVHAPPARIVEPLRWQFAQLGIEGAPDATLEQIVIAQRERAKTIKEMAMNSVFFFKAPSGYDEKAVAKHVSAPIVDALEELAGRFKNLASWSAPDIHALINSFAQERSLSLGKLAQPIRLAVSGGTVSPPIDATLSILGPTETLARISAALGAWRRP